MILKNRFLFKLILPLFVSFQIIQLLSKTFFVKDEKRKYLGKDLKMALCIYI